MEKADYVYLNKYVYLTFWEFVLFSLEIKETFCSLLKVLASTQVSES